MSIRTLLAAAAITAILPALLPPPARAADDATRAAAQPTERAQAHRAPRNTSYLAFLRDAGLSGEQNDQLHDLLRANAIKLQPMKQRLRDVLAQIADRLSGTGPVEAAQLAALEGEAATIRQSIDAQWLNAAIEARALLTPEQLARVSEAHLEQAALRKPASEGPTATAKP